VTDEEILENYASEYCEMLNFYDSVSHYYYEIKIGIAFVFKDFFSFAMLKIENFENQKYILSMANSGYLFKDNAPFEQKKEVNCED